MRPEMHPVDKALLSPFRRGPGGEKKPPSAAAECLIPILFIVVLILLGWEVNNSPAPVDDLDAPGLGFQRVE